MFALSVLLAPLPSRQTMHIPDGYLSPATALAMYLLVLPFWIRGARTLRQKMTGRNVPLVSLFAAFSFVIMMFNVPLPGGTTGHAVGGALAAVILGPEIAMVAISIALAIQALFFGDGGLLAFGANCFNMAVVLPYFAYAVYRLLAGKSAVTSLRRVWGAALGGYVGLSLAALCAGIEFGIQPALFHTVDGMPLYAPYPLSVAIPAMVLPHLLLASLIEGALTGGVVVYLQRTNPSLLALAAQPAFDDRAGSFRRLRVLWIGLAALIVAVPLGLLAPGTAWGEWSGRELAQMGLGFVPQGMARLSGLWSAPLARYDLPMLGDANLGYVSSAALGVALVAAIVWLLTTSLTARKEKHSGAQMPEGAAGQAGGRKHVLAGSLANIAETLEQSLFAEHIARRPGLLQTFDPRVKLLGALAFMLAVSLSHNLAVIGGLYVVTLILAWRSAVPMNFFVKRVWLFMPFFTGIIALPALFLVPGPALLQLPVGLTVTSTGLTTALFLLLRVGTSVSAALLLVLTTPWNSVLKSLAVLRVPDAFVMVLGMTYRYVDLLLRLTGDMLLSRQSREVGRLSSRDERRIIAASTGVLLSRSLQLSEEVYLAMQARGLRGAPRTMDTFQMQTRDWLFGVGAAAIILAAIWFGR